MKAHGKNVNNPQYKEKSRANRRACGKDKERYVQQLWDCVSKGDQVKCTLRYGQS